MVYILSKCKNMAKNVQNPLSTVNKQHKYPSFLLIYMISHHLKHYKDYLMTVWHCTSIILCHFLFNTPSNLPSQSWYFWKIPNLATAFAAQKYRKFTPVDLMLTARESVLRMMRLGCLIVETQDMFQSGTMMLWTETLCMFIMSVG